MKPDLQSESDGPFVSTAELAASVAYPTGEVAKHSNRLNADFIYFDLHILNAMEIEGQIEVDAPRETIVEKMQEPEVLQRTIPNCKKVELIGEREYEASISESISMISLDMEVNCAITEFQPPEQFSVEISGEGLESNNHMNAKGTYDLSEVNGGGTQIDYHMDIQVSGKLASLGFRMIKSTVTKRVDQMTENLRAEFTD